ncbi:S-adenosyl-L-methionine-dependent methyltransferase [Gonapodya prolifera JEL478]|uniref:S-adenosyl-L-methionine-dependent methyltransferase n=1 Tax=Gonapodya prolifera (strain JEL478) TaxID=1344416 RepID=A0A139A8Y9_GONPJ|nr:S-adenosyl-L-methionine-dependent methyltransferase [Gonapodya prolifera JEL478]|eukprot:KXS12863.1 S-adenosyl-L-methionine-dependent methyltransferase [Gonapodya prolifera JEL478]
MSVSTFYDSLASLYSGIYEDWPSSVRAQGRAIDALICEYKGISCDTLERGKLTVLDAACGIGTQLLGVAELGYTVLGSDLSSGEIERCKSEVQRWRVAERVNSLEVRDMRHVEQGEKVDVVMAMDNAVTHLLEEEDLLKAFRAFYARLKPGGLCLISVRDYGKEIPSSQRTIGKTIGKPYGVRVQNGKRFVAFQMWEFVPPPSSSPALGPSAMSDVYRISMYFVDDPNGAIDGTQGNATEGDSQTLKTHVMRTYYRAYSLPELQRAMSAVGFIDVRVREAGSFFQPVIGGVKPQ